MCTKAPTQNWLSRTALSYPPHTAQKTNSSFKEKTPFFNLLSDAESLWRDNNSSLAGQCVLIEDDSGKQVLQERRCLWHAASMLQTSYIKPTWTRNWQMSLFSSQQTPLCSVYLKNTALCRQLDNPVTWSMTQRDVQWRREGSKGCSETILYAHGPAPPPNYTFTSSSASAAGNCRVPFLPETFLRW